MRKLTTNGAEPTACGRTVVVTTKTKRKNRKPRWCVVWNAEREMWYGSVQRQKWCVVRCRVVVAEPVTGGVTVM